MDKHEIAVIRAEEARQLLSNPMFERAFADTRAACLEALAASKRSDTEAFKDIHRMIECLDRVKRAVKVHIDTGKLAQREIEGRKLFSLNR
jgi:hypothetical protein